MKIIEEWSVGDYKITIKAKFITRGYYSGDWNCSYVDCVRFYTSIKDGVMEKHIEDISSPRTHYEKSWMFGKKKYKTFQESYALTLNEIKEEIEDYISGNTRYKEITLSDQKVTDGLPDSLKEM